MKPDPVRPSEGKTVALLLGLNPGNFITTRVASVQAVPGGFTGDRHFGVTHPADSRTPYYPRGASIFNDRQISIVSVEELNEITSRLNIAEILPEWLGANIVVSGIPRLTSLAPGTRFMFSGGASLYVTHSNNPCSGPGEILQSHYPERDGMAAAFVKQAMHLRGLVAVVDLPGEIHTGEKIAVRPEQRYTYLEESGA